MPGITAMQALAASSGHGAVSKDARSLALMPLTAGVDKLRTALADASTPSWRTRAAACCPRCSTPSAAPDGSTVRCRAARSGCPARQARRRRRSRHRAPYLSTLLVVPERERPGQRAMTRPHGKVWSSSAPGRGRRPADAAGRRRDRRRRRADLGVEPGVGRGPGSTPDRTPGSSTRRGCRWKASRPLYERAAARRAAPSRASTPAIPRSGVPCRSSGSCARVSGLEVEAVPGVCAFTAVAALIGRELTIPEVAQSVILTRLEGGKTPMPPGERCSSSPSTGRRWRSSCRRPAPGSCRTSCWPAAIPPTPRRRRLPGDLARRADRALHASASSPRPSRRTGSGSTRCSSSGPPLAAGGTRSHLYHPGHFHGFRRAEPDARRQLRRRQPMSGSGERPSSELLREPDLPRTMKVRPKALRTGWTTGTCGAAAAKAASIGTFATHGRRLRSTSRCPAAAGVSFAVESGEVELGTCDRSGGQGRRRRPGRDARRSPDRAVTWRETPGIELDGGVGVGVVTKPGLGIPVGEPGDQLRAPRDDRAGRRRGDRPDDAALRSSSAFPTASGWHARPPTPGSASSAASRSWARPGSCGRSRPRHGGPA